MPAWITVYCKKPVSDLTGEAILEAVKDCDWWALAEDQEVDEDTVDEAVAKLRFDPREEAFHYKDEGERPLVMHIWTDPVRVKEEIGEIGDEALAAQLEGVVAVVAIEMGFGQLQDMGAVFAIEICGWMAESKAGLVCDFNDEWYSRHEGDWVPLEETTVLPERAGPP